MTIRLLGVAIALLLVVGPAAGQPDRNRCTAQCGGRAGGEAANPPSVVACFRKCMGVSRSSDGVTRKTYK